MSFEIDELFRIYVLPMGRMGYAVRGLQAALREEDGPALAEAAQGVMAAVGEAQTLEMRYRERANQPQFGPRAMSLESNQDRLVSSIDGVVESARRSFPPEHPMGAAAARLYGEVFSRGLTELTQRPFVEEVESVGRLIARLTPPGDLAQEATTLHLEPYVVALKDANAALRVELESRPRGATWDEVRAARAKANGLLVELIARVLGRYPTHGAEDTAARNRLLDPLWTQQQALARSYRRTSTATDLNPETGEELPEGVPAGQPDQPEPPSDAGEGTDPTA